MTGARGSTAGTTSPYRPGRRRFVPRMPRIVGRHERPAPLAHNEEPALARLEPVVVGTQVVERVEPRVVRLGPGDAVVDLHERARASDVRAFRMRPQQRDPL